MEEIANQVPEWIAAGVILLFGLMGARGGKFGKAIKEAFDAFIRERLGLGRANLDPVIRESALELAERALELVADEAEKFAEEDVYPFVKNTVLSAVGRLRETTGVPIEFTDEQLDALIAKAIRRAKREFDAAV